MRSPLVLLPTLAVLATPVPAHAIIDGTATDVAAVPWTVALVEAGVPAVDGQFCGGTLITPAAVLTAAHCVQGETAEAITVVHSRTRLSDEGEGERVGVRSVHVAPGASGDNVPDIAVLGLTRAVTTVTPVRMAGPADRGLLAAGTTALAAGWGRTSNASQSSSDHLRSGRVRIRSTSLCRDAYGSDYERDVMLCAGGEQDSCNGDSGGPVVVGDGAQAVQVGVVSFGGDRCGDPDAPGVYARVDALRDWIDRAAGVPSTQASDGATGGESSTVGTVPARTRLRIAGITCPGVRCRVVLAVTGAQPHAITVRAQRIARGGRPAVVRTVRATRVANGRWVARVDLPYGAVQLRVSTQRQDGRPAGPSVTERLQVQ